MHLSQSAYLRYRKENVHFYINICLTINNSNTTYVYGFCSISLISRATPGSKLCLGPQKLCEVAYWGLLSCLCLTSLFTQSARVRLGSPHVFLGNLRRLPKQNSYKPDTHPDSQSTVRNNGKVCQRIITKSQKLAVINLLLSENLTTLLPLLFSCVAITIFSSVVSLSTPSTTNRPRKNQ